MSAFDRLHLALQHHIVNSLGWKTLRPLQEQAVEPILAGDDVLLIAPTASGKTEAALFPMLSRMLTEPWGGLSVLYVCPLKALLNSLAIRLQSYAVLIGRRVEVWHGDVVSSRRVKSQRAHAKLQKVCAEHPWVEKAATALIRRQSGALEWWNFAGQLFNAALAGRFRGLGLEASYDHFAVTVHGNADVASIRSAIEHLVADTSTTLEIPVAKTIWPELKFAACVPDHLLTRMFASRMDQSSVIEMIQGQGMRVAPIP